MAKKKAAKKRAKPKAKPSVSKKIKHIDKTPQQKEIKVQELLPPITDKELLEEEVPKKKDEFFNEEDMKEFSVVDEEEGLDEDSSAPGESEPAWDDE